jgi:hypothetical protein
MDVAGDSAHVLTGNTIVSPGGLGISSNGFGTVGR